MGNAKNKKPSKKQLQGRSATPDVDGPGVLIDATDTGCLVCGKDDDHARILLCEVCNGEYHTYCLDPQLAQIPENAWYCDKCQPSDTELLDKQVSSLPTEFTSRFGEICWAQGGVGYGWWPCCIFDPRLTVGSARAEARRHLGKRHLLYFFQCIDLPFSVLPETKILPWVEGLAENFHLGRAAKNYSKARFGLFQKAMQAALLEQDKPRSKRLDDNDPQQQPTLLPSPMAVASTPNLVALSLKQRRLVKPKTTAKRDIQKQSLPLSPNNKRGGIRKVKRSRANRSDAWTLIHGHEKGKKGPTAIQETPLSLSALASVSSNRSTTKSNQKKRPAAIHNLSSEERPSQRRSQRTFKPVHGDFPFVRHSLDRKLLSSSSSTMARPSNPAPLSLPLAAAPDDSTLLLASDNVDANAKTGRNAAKAAAADEELYCTIFEVAIGSPPNHARIESPVGFVVLPSKQRSTFADLREAMEKEIDTLGSLSATSTPCNCWKFYIPPLGPVSQKQETKLGAVAPFLAKGEFNREMGEGSSHNPFRLQIVRMKQP